jgi:hypothetical protein
MIAPSEPDRYNSGGKAIAASSNRQGESCRLRRAVLRHSGTGSHLQKDGPEGAEQDERKWTSATRPFGIPCERTGPAVRLVGIAHHEDAAAREASARRVGIPRQRCARQPGQRAVVRHVQITEVTGQYCATVRIPNRAVAHPGGEERQDDDEENASRDSHDSPPSHGPLRGGKMGAQRFPATGLAVLAEPGSVSHSSWDE